ncbi:DUF2325 domain-containing protein [Xylophilus sp.]|uniref:DUF2325 domain-containing protein n=1 Tax=Xylophilus sp. TaxID=2653893 RepID=UPI0013BE293F|nr:DUF2325 domain-containing protein [Xylophilus sp.]KAF1048695.1 MAG: hypothetical protein GAK38_01139 [Xylophilus sp.]
MRLRHRPPMPTDDARALRLQLDALVRENAVLARELAAAQERSMQLRHAQAAEVARLEAALIRSRAEAIAQRTAAAAAREELAALRQAVPGLPRRVELLAHVERLMEALHSLRRDRLGRQLREERLARAAARPAPPTGGLREKAVLCVGREPGLAALSQRLVEIAGGRFLRHDGGDAAADGGTEDAAALEASLQAADLVICQTGCLSHGAYWRVQDHCRRTGKQCVLLDQPAQTVQVVRGPRELQATAQAPQE